MEKTKSIAGGAFLKVIMGEEVEFGELAVELLLYLGGAARGVGVTAEEMDAQMASFCTWYRKTLLDEDLTNNKDER